MDINLEKLNHYLANGEILEFESDEACMDYSNTYDYQNLKSVEEMKEYQNEYGFNIGKRRYYINTEKALDVFTENIVSIHDTYSQSEDMTFILKETKAKSGELISTEVVGFYFGKPNMEDTRIYIGSLKAEYGDEGE